MVEIICLRSAQLLKAIQIQVYMERVKVGTHSLIEISATVPPLKGFM